ncbi:MAG TPA: GDSL-type esterase/lipase family protein [Gaiellaceae bacterium]|nr:GDSL-type esterase/lipase family protein [Gaiellaceae bacterium]
MRRILPAVVLALAAFVAAAAARPASTPVFKPRPRVTLIGDSIAAGIAYVPDARRLLARGIDLRLDVRVCRRLVGESCPYDGQRPPNVLDTVAATGTALGRVVVIDVGYNDYAEEYPQGIDDVMRSLTAAGVRTVVWVTLREKHSMYPPINAAIRRAARRWRQIVVLDWNAYSRGRPAWFVGDGLHLNPRGALGLAKLIRPAVVASACKQACAPPKTAA